MTFDSVSVLGQLQDLERQIADATKYLGALQGTHAGKDPAEIRRTVVGSERLITAMALTTSRIKTQVVDTDGLGPKVDSLAELALRAVRMVLLADLVKLQNLGGRPVRGYALSSARGRLRRVDDLAAFVREKLDRITLMWLDYRDPPSEDRVAFRFALCAAAQAMQRLRKVPALERFLREGSGRNDWPELAEIANRMRAAFEIRIEVQPDQPLLSYAQRLHEVSVMGQP